ncbi:MAG: ribulokinase, partial [Chitinophagaceae bacterium]
MKHQLVIGLDFGTDSVRALVVNAATGMEISSAVHYYKRWQQQRYCDPATSRFRQHPLDYIEGMEESIRQSIASLTPEQRGQIAGLSVDTTGSTPGPVNRQGVPLALLPGFADNPNAMFVLWKDHTAQQEADEINALAHSWKTDYTKYSGGLYSPEWFWAKLLHILRADEAVRDQAFTWAEHCDWMPALLTGNNDPLTWKRSRCAAGHKAMWHETFPGLPGEDFLQALDPLLTGLRDRLYEETFTADECAGTIAPEWAQKLGLPANVKIGVGSLDAHAGAAGACIGPYTLVKVTGTSTCDMVVVPYETHKDQLVHGICGQVNGSIVPGMLGMEAGQSAFGDVYQWFVQVLSFPLTT